MSRHVLITNNTPQTLTEDEQSLIETNEIAEIWVGIPPRWQRTIAAGFTGVFEIETEVLPSDAAVVEPDRAEEALPEL